MLILLRLLNAVFGTSTLLHVAYSTKTVNLVTSLHLVYTQSMLLLS